MARPEINENCHYVENDSHWCKIKPETFHFDILCFYGVIKESFPDIGAESGPPPPPNEIGLRRVTEKKGYSDL